MPRGRSREYYDDADEEEALLGHVGQELRVQRQDVVPGRVVHREVVDNERLIEERNQRIQEVEQDVTDIFKMMQDMDMMIEEQGEKLETGVEHMERGRSHAQEARREVHQAEQRALKNRRRQCWVIACIATALLIVVLWSTHMV
eukprot:TRINITY_DN5447_c0_g2_i5.p2 TRINITY_DN5447_c0_g2~~TRINITY_DN5447_c0_g2_i5.p2  ORF type:complete len:144 (+),score=15.14 TRINITY_DN5447_c0_g2_i5:58-489(+)